MEAPVAAEMGVPTWLLRKLYCKGSLIQRDERTFALVIQNPLGNATLVAPPRFIINGVTHDPADIEVEDIDLAAITPSTPHVFAKGDEHEMTFQGHLLRGGNRLQGVFETDEYGRLEMFVEARAARWDDSEE